MRHSGYSRAGRWLYNIAATKVKVYHQHFHVGGGHDLRPLDVQSLAADDSDIQTVRHSDIPVANFDGTGGVIYDGAHITYSGACNCAGT